MRRLHLCQGCRIQQPHAIISYGGRTAACQVSQPIEPDRDADTPHIKNEWMDFEDLDKKMQILFYDLVGCIDAA